MVKRRERALVTRTVLGSQVVATATGATALALTTKEQGTIAFEVTLETIRFLRRDLAKAETILRQAQAPGRA